MWCSVVCRCASYILIKKIGKNGCFNVRLAGGNLYGKQLFTWLSLVVSLMAPFVLSFFPLDVLDEIWDLIESVSEGFLTYSYIVCQEDFHSKTEEGQQNRPTNP